MLTITHEPICQMSPMVSAQAMISVKVTEKHSDYVWVKADSAEEAKKMAVEVAECEYELLYDCEVVEEQEI